jgi:hypothetical protein
LHALDGDAELDLLVNAVQLIRPAVAYRYDMDADVAQASRRGVLERHHELAVAHLGTPFVRTRV